MADRRSGEVERDPDPDSFALQPCSSFQGPAQLGMYCTECRWSYDAHERAEEEGRDVRDERAGR